MRSYWRWSSAASVAGRGAATHGLSHLGLEGEVEGLQHLGPGLAVARAGTPQRLLEPAQGLLVPFEQLDLELVEASWDALLVDHRHLVMGDLGALRADAGAPRSQAHERQQRLAAQVRGQQRHDLVGRSAGGARTSSSRRALPCGSFSCQRPRRSRSGAGA